MAGFVRVALPVLLVAVLGCSSPPPDTTQVISGPVMGTTFAVKIVHLGDSVDRPEGLSEAVTAILTDVDRKMSTYKPESEVSRFNRSDSTEPFPVSAETAAVVSAALDLAEVTGGALDITVGPLVNAYGFGPDGTREWPTEVEFETAMDSIGSDHLTLDPAALTLVKDRPEVEIDLSSIAKGYAVDLVAEALDARGFTDYMVEVGGEVRAVGKNADLNTWRLGIERPDAARGIVQRVVALDGMAMATSGDYRNYREVDGERFSHLLDPRTGRPIRHRLASVSVITDTCARADGMATALIVLGEEEGLALAESLDLAALFLVKDDEGGFREVMTPAFDRLAEPSLQPN